MNKWTLVISLGMLVVGAGLIGLSNSHLLEVDEMEINNHEYWSQRGIELSDVALQREMARRKVSFVAGLSLIALAIVLVALGSSKSPLSSLDARGRK